MTIALYSVEGGSEGTHDDGVFKEQDVWPEVGRYTRFDWYTIRGNSLIARRKRYVVFFWGGKKDE